MRCSQRAIETTAVTVVSIDFVAPETICHKHAKARAQ